MSYRIVMKKLIFKYIYKLIVINIFVLFIMINLQSKRVYAYWYEEIEAFETENIDSKWWLSRKKKEELKKEQQIEINKKIEESKNKELKDKKIKWVYNDFDITRYPKNKWEIIDEDGDGIGHNYYFDKEGYLLIDTVTPDYKIVDNKGREVDYNLKPIKYEINKNIVEEESSQDTNNINTLYNLPTIDPPKVLIGEGVVLKKQEKIYDSTINKDVIAYVSSSSRFIKETKGTIYNEIRWKKCSSLKGKGGYVVFDNPQNNFNKITGYIASQYNTFDDDNTICSLKVYDADIYDKYDKANRLYDIEEIYSDDSFNNRDAIKFSFTFDRSIKRLRFEIEVDGEYKNRTCYLKDLKYGFSKTAFSEELKRKKEDEEEIEELKRLGIYVEDFSYFSSLDEDNDIIEDYEEETENENNDDRIGGISWISEEETRNYEDVVRDRNTGPAFDENIKSIKEIGPAITVSEYHKDEIDSCSGGSK